MNARFEMLIEGLADPRLAEGMVVRFGGADWGVAGLEADPKAAGRVRLNLERAR